jgi:hypothetical protein
MNFIEACKLMRADKKVRRKIWYEGNSENISSELVEYCQDAGDFILINSYHLRLSVEDCLSDDWEEYVE